MATHAGLSVLDFVVIVAYFVGVIAVGIWVSFIYFHLSVSVKVFVVCGNFNSSYMQNELNACRSSLNASSLSNHMQLAQLWNCLIKLHITGPVKLYIRDLKRGIWLYTIVLKNMSEFKRWMDSVDFTVSNLRAHGSHSLQDLPDLAVVVLEFMKNA